MKQNGYQVINELLEMSFKKYAGAAVQRAGREAKKHKALTTALTIAVPTHAPGPLISAALTSAKARKNYWHTIKSIFRPSSWKSK